MLDDNFIFIQALTFQRGSHTLFDALSLNMPRGKITAILGPSGCGKTTLLQLMGAQLRPTSGCVWVDGLDVNQLSRKALFALRRDMGVLFQSGGLFTDLTVFENVAFPLREHTQLVETMIRDIVLMKLELVGLRGARDLLPAELSGGMARRVAMARALALDPKLMMYDEPFSGQDPITTAVLLRLIKQLNDVLGLTSVVVSHHVTEIARIADYMYLISSGKLVGEGTPDELFANQAPEVQQFVHGLAQGVFPFHYPAKTYVEELLQ